MFRIFAPSFLPESFSELILLINMLAAHPLLLPLPKLYTIDLVNTRHLVPISYRHRKGRVSSLCVLPTYRAACTLSDDPLFEVMYSHIRSHSHAAPRVYLWKHSFILTTSLFWRFLRSCHQQCSQIKTKIIWRVVHKAHKTSVNIHNIIVGSCCVVLPYYHRRKPMWSVKRVRK